MRKRRLLIEGPVLLGFAELFDEAWGKPSAEPYPRLTPSRVGPVLLPFECPHCGVVNDPQQAEHYRDPEREFSWCPSCRRRYVLNGQGTPLAEPLPPGATSAPVRIERPSPTHHMSDGPSPLECD